MTDTTAIEASAVAISQKVTVASGGASFFAFLAKVDVIAWGGLTVAVLGLLMQLYFAIARNRREKAEHEMRKIEYAQRLKNLKERKDETNQ